MEVAANLINKGKSVKAVQSSKVVKAVNAVKARTKNYIKKRTGPI